MSEIEPGSQPLGLRIQPAAVDDLRRQAAYYQKEATTEVARRFLQAARTSMDDLTLRVRFRFRAW